MASITQRFLVTVSTVSSRNTSHNDPPFLAQKRQKCGGGGYFQKNWVGVCSTFPETLLLLQTKLCDFSYPISDMKPWSPTRLECVTSCYGTYMVVGVNVIREMVSLPNDEEEANSSKKCTQFKARVHKPYAISDQNGQN